MLGEMLAAGAYSVTGGTALIDGAGYAVKRGMTLVDGVAYEIGSSHVPVTITGTGGEDDCYCEIGGVKYYAATSGVETHSGDIIHLYAGSKITINGTSVDKSYNWTIPHYVSEITIDLDTSVGGGSSFFIITVTTA